MRELSLFTGAGGGVLGTKLLGWETIGYVEYEKYCQKVLKQRIADGILDAAPIFGDIRSFINEGYAEAYQGMVDVVTAGFPCQPFSFAGKNLGEDDPRNMWPQTAEVLRIVRPRYALLENVPGLLAHEYTRRIFGDLAESGYDARWCVLSAASCGALHKRERLWIVAHSNGERCPSLWRDGSLPNDAQAERTGSDNRGRTTKPYTGEWWSNEPRPFGVAHGVARRVDRLKAIGNGQVPQVARIAWELLSNSVRA